MNPILSHTPRLVFSIAIWLCVASVIATVLVLSGTAAWANALFFALPCCLVFGFISTSAFYVGRALTMQRRQILRVLMVFGCSAAISSAIWVLLGTAWNQFSLSLNEEWAGIRLNRLVLSVMFISGMLLYLLSILAYDVLIAFENLRLAEKREAASQVLAREAELQMLRTQINPHFLFNSLNSISALTALDPAGARHMTIELAQFFRQTLALSERRKITLAEEIALCEHFLSIEKIRFGKKLQVQMQINAATQSCLLPPMILQPLLENAIKHGIRDLVDGGTIHVEATPYRDYLILRISNPIDTTDADSATQQSQAKKRSEGTGTGLKNLHARLRSLYGQGAQADWICSEGKFQVTITLPLET